MSQKVLSLALFSLLAAMGCNKLREPASIGLELSLYTGIRQLVNIGDAEAKIMDRSTWTPERVDLSSNPGTQPLRFTHMLFFKEIGTRAYFRNGHVALIEIQDPFEGVVQGKKLAVFHMTRSQPEPWDQTLIKELGTPQSRAGGGNFGAEVLYYSWGDIAFNGNGPNEIAIYKDPEIVKFRQNGFGRKVHIF